MFGFIRKFFIATMAFVGCASLFLNPLKCVSMSSQFSKVNPGMVSTNGIKSLFYPYSVLVNSCNDVNNPHAKSCIPDVVKNINIKVFNLISRTNETRFVSWHETSACKYRLDASVFNDRQRWNSDKCKSRCNELIAKSRICDVGKYLDHVN